MKYWAAGLAALTLVRLAVATIAPLAPDETYYWIWSRALAPGYVDHPPMVALWIRAGTLIAGDGALGIRLLGPLSAALGSLLLADAAERMLPHGSIMGWMRGTTIGRIAGEAAGQVQTHGPNGQRAGIRAAALLNATLFMGVGTVIMTPDTPLLFFWTAGLWAAVRAWRSDRTGWWCMTGLFAGLALASKYTAAFLWAGLLLWLLWVPELRRHLRRPAPWIGVALGVAVFVPVVVWNAQHGWAGFLRQGGRVSDWQPARAIGFLGELIGGQVGLATPLVFVLCVAGIAVALRTAWRRRDPAATLLVTVTVPAAVVFVQHALGDRVQGNWPAILYPAACIAAAGLAAPRWQVLERPAVGLGLALTALVYLQASTFGLPLPPSRDPVALQLAGWDELAAEVEAARHQTGAAFVAADQYAVASELAHDLPAEVPVIGVDPRWNLTSLPPAAPADAVGLLVREAGRTDPIDPTQWREAVPVAQASRGPARHFMLYRIVAAASLRDAVSLPRPAGR